MSAQIYVNLPVKNLQDSTAFFTALGYQFNPQFTNDVAACMIVGENIFVMLLTEPFFKKFTEKNLVDAKKSTEVIVCLSAESRTQVDEIVRTAVAAGGRIYNEPQDHGFMYGHGFEDLDGHQWEFSYMDPSHIQ